MNPLKANAGTRNCHLRHYVKLTFVLSIYLQIGCNLFVLHCSAIKPWFFLNDKKPAKKRFYPWNSFYSAVLSSDQRFSEPWAHQRTIHQLLGFLKPNLIASRHSATRQTSLKRSMLSHHAQIHNINKLRGIIFRQLQLAQTTFYEQK